MEIVHLRPCPTPAITATLEVTPQVLAAWLFLSQPIDWVIMQGMERSSQRFDPGWKGRNTIYQVLNFLSRVTASLTRYKGQHMVKWNGACVADRHELYNVFDLILGF